MYAVIKTGGKQYRVQAGDVLVVEKLAGEPGANLTFSDVLMIGDDAGTTVGAPTVAGAVVTGALLETRKGEKVKIFKKIRRQGQAGMGTNIAGTAGNQNSRAVGGRHGRSGMRCG